MLKERLERAKRVCDQDDEMQLFQICPVFPFSFVSSQVPHIIIYLVKYLIGFWPPCDLEQKHPAAKGGFYYNC